MPELGKRADGRTISGVSYRTVGGLAVAVLVVVFIAMNRDDTAVSFVLFTARTALWVALGVAAAGGFLAGYLLGRKRYRS